MLTQINRSAVRRRIRYRVRRKCSGSASRPRLAVHRSAKHIYAQVIDDTRGRTLVQASSREREVLGGLSGGGNVEAAKKVGQAIGERLKQAGIDTVVFDRGGHLYHGRVKALAEAAREAGLKF